MRPWQTCSLLAVLAAAVAPAWAAPPQRPDAERTLSPYFLVESDDPSVDQLPLLSTTADVEIAGVIAEVTITQIYKNDGTRPIEAIYVFPASTRAAVHAMKMTIGERVIVAEVREREQARQEYEQARQAGQSASLLEQQRPNVFQMSVANILPGDRITIEMSYTELLVPEEGTYEFVYPTVVGPRYSNQKQASAPSSEQWVQTPYQHQGEASLYELGIHVTLAAGMPIQDIECPSHATQIAYDGPTTARIELDPAEASGGNRDFILRYRLAGEAIETGLLLAPGNDESFFLLMVQPPDRVDMTEVPPREYIFVMDVSGSMSGFPTETSKQLLRDLLESLRPVDSFNVLFFSGGSWALSERSLPATPENVKDALQQVEGQQGAGGTELLPALQHALALPRAEHTSRTVVISTDGYVAVEQQAFELIREHLGDANLFAFGIGSAVNRYLIEGLAEAGMGAPFIATGPEDATAVAERFRHYVERPVLTHVRVGFEGFDAYDVEPQAVPDVLAERPVIAFGKWRGPAQGTITVSGETPDGPFQEQIDVTDARLYPRAVSLRYLWARHRIRMLADIGPFGQPAGGTPPDSPRRQEVKQLGLRYNLLTPFTSFVAVDRTVRSTDGPPDAVKQPLPLPEGVSDRAVGAISVSGPLSGMATSGTVQVACGERAPLEEWVNPLTMLPLRGSRYFTAPLDLVPGTTLAIQSTPQPLGPPLGLGHHINGQDARTTPFRIDGLDTSWGTRGLPAVLPMLDSIAEVHIRTSPDATLGHSAGAVTEVTLKSGSSDFDGSVFFLGSTPGMTAREPLSGLRPDSHFAQMGFTVGGPVRREKVFFFAAYQQTREALGRVLRGIVPTTDVRAGDFAGAPTLIYDPTTGNVDGSGRRPFPGNQIPPERLSPAAIQLLDRLPRPTRPDAPWGEVNFETGQSTETLTHALDTRLDWHISDSHRLSARVSLARPEVTENALALAEEPSGTALARTRQLALVSGIEHTAILMPTLYSSSHVGLAIFNQRSGALADGSIARPPIVTVAGDPAPLLGAAASQPGEESLRLWQGDSQLTKVWGLQVARAGIAIRQGRTSFLAMRAPTAERALYRFGPLQTASPTDPASQLGLANSWASFLLDRPAGAARHLELQTMGTRGRDLALYVQGYWRVNRHLDVDPGLRYEYHTARVGLDSTGGLSNYDPATGTLHVAGIGDVPRNLGVRTGAGLLLPRLDVAYDLAANGDTVLRAAYGQHAIPFDSHGYGTNFPLVQNDLREAAAYQSTGSLATGLPALEAIEVPDSSGTISVARPALESQSYFALPLDLFQGRLHAWQVSLDRRLPFRLRAEIAYVGNRGVDVPVLMDANAGQVPGAGDAGRPEMQSFGHTAPTWTWWRGRSTYHALQASLTRYSHDSMFFLAYTLGRSRDYASDGRPISTPADPERSWGRSDFDRTHALTLAFALQDDPVGGGWRNRILTGWGLAGILRAQSGTPVDITLLASTLGAPGNVQRPDRVTASGSRSQGVTDVPGFDASAFTLPAPATWGSLTRNASLSGPAYVDIDASLVKRIATAGRAYCELRLEVFNVANRAQYANPRALMGEPLFGQVTDTIPYSQRMARLALRVTF